MKSPLRILLLVLLPFVAYSQNRSGNECGQTAIYALETLPKLVEGGNRVEADSILNAWIYYCGKNEYSIRLKTLLSIADGNFTPFDFDQYHYQALLGYIADYKFRQLMDTVHENPRELYLYYFVKPDLAFEYDAFTARLAERLRMQRPANSCDTETMILDGYANDFRSFFTTLKDTACHVTPATYYRSQLRAVERKVSVSAGLYTGIWIPYGRNSLLGSHPLFGFHFGAGRSKVIYDAVFEFRFGDSREEYVVQYKGAAVTTDHFFGGYMGVNVSYELFRRGKYGAYALGGIGGDGFDVIEGSEEEDGKSIFVFNANAGMGWKRFSKDGTYVGLEARHNFVRYKNEGGTSLFGNTVTTKFVLGIFKNDRRQRELEYLRKLTN